ncbi:MAG: DUF302 domain-containing protein [Rhodocyclaceae bacterium]|nr:DUF302 domain-containing protein [Rhodocyclaceae bacterium]MCW5613755.1 DUF302 domain-containing protein [Rhodocyclaceae bacterium]
MKQTMIPEPAGCTLGHYRPFVGLAVRLGKESPAARVEDKSFKEKSVMQKSSWFIAIPLALFLQVATAADGLIALKSSRSVAETMDRMETVAKEKGMKIFARIDHAAGAASVGAELRPTTLLVFGSPKGGTPFMQCAQTVGIDLPLKVLVWEDAAGQVWLGYNDPAWIAKRHEVADCAVAGNIAGALEAMSRAALAAP